MTHAEVISQMYGFSLHVSSTCTLFLFLKGETANHDVYFRPGFIGICYRLSASSGSVLFCVLSCNNCRRTVLSQIRRKSLVAKSRKILETKSLVP